MDCSATATDSDEPLTPAGRLFLRPEMNQIIHVAIGVENPFDVDVFKSLIRDSFLLKHPRFCSLMVRDRHGREHWRRTSVDVDRHFIVIESPVSDAGDDDSAVNEYLADMSIGPGLSSDKPLWEIHFLKAHKCFVFRIHHALGDGISLMSMFLASCRQKADPEALPNIGPVSSRREGKRRDYWFALVLGFLRMVWYSFVFVLEFILRSLWICDRKTAISGGEGIELWPRKLVTARFRLQDMKAVKKAVPNAELSNLMSSNSDSRWGNQFGIILLPVGYHKSGPDPLMYLKRAKVMIDRKKQSLEAHFSYRIGYYVMNYVGSKLAGLLNYRIVCNTTFTISNILGPQEEITLAGNPITYLRVNSSGLPHALTMHMLTYAGRADMQILVAKDIIPDPEFLAKCFEDALLEMKAGAEGMPSSKSG